MSARGGTKKDLLRVIERLQAENCRLRDGILHVATECNCRCEHGAEGGEHLQHIENMLKDVLATSAGGPR